MATKWESDGELFELIEAELFTAVLGDVLDELGHQRQFLPPAIRPLQDQGVVAGRAMPVLEADAFDDTKPFGRMFEALDDLRPGEIYVASGGSPHYAVFGGLMSVAATARGARGAVLHGYHRDTRELLGNGFSVFSLGSYSQDQRVRGRVIDYRCRIEIGAAVVNPGDIIVGDIDGVLVVPRSAERDAVRAALEKVRTESEVRKALARGLPAQEAFDRYGVL